MEGAVRGPKEENYDMILLRYCISNLFTLNNSSHECLSSLHAENN